MTSRTPFFASLVLLAIILTAITLITNHRWERAPAHAVFADADDGWTSVDVLDGKHKVPLEIHIMSKCPDAKGCLEMLIAPAMEEIADIVDFKMSFIGRPTAAGISCMHGPSECLSNSVHLCAAHLYPLSTSLPFSLCLTHNYTLLPEQSFLESCASQHNVKFSKINDCVSDLGPNGGLELLRESVEHSRDVGAEVSCTVRVKGDTWCVRDGGRWKGCQHGSEPEDLVEWVRELWKERARSEWERKARREGGAGGRGLRAQRVRKVGEWLRDERRVWMR